MGWNPFKKKSWTDAGNAIIDTGKAAADAATKAANDAAAETQRLADAAAAETKKQADALAKATADAAAAAEKAANDAAKATKDYANSLVKDTKKAVQHTTDICTAQTNTYAKQGFDVTSTAWKNGSKAAVAAVSKGVEYTEYAATEAYEWADANACYIGLNMALTTGCVLYFTPKPEPAEPGTITSTAISTTYLSYIAAKGANTAMAMTVGSIITNSIYLIPGVKGHVDKKILQNVITNTIATCNPAVLAVSLATPAGVGIFIGSVISPIVAQLVCEKVAPKGFTKAIN